MTNIQNVGYIKPVTNLTEKNTAIETTIKESPHKEQGEKIIAGLAALGAIAAAGIAIAKGKGKHAADLGQEAAEIINKKAGKTAQELSREALEKAEKRIPEAVEAMQNGGNYLKIKKSSTKNLTHEGKKLVKGEIQKLRAERLAVEKAQKETSKFAKETIENANGVIKNMNQGMKKAGTEEVMARMHNGNTAVRQTEILADVAENIAEEAPTKSNQMWAKRAQNKLNDAKRLNNSVQENGNKRLQEIARETETKAKNIEQLKASPNYELGMEKQAKNAEKTSKKAIERKAKKERLMPGYQKALADIKREGSSENISKLQGIINSPKSSPSKKKVAQDLLATLTN